MLRLANIVATAINPALLLLPPKFDSLKARVMMLATGLQESRFEFRYQIASPMARMLANMRGVVAKGPARGFWQFEQGGGVKGVMRHPATRDLLRALCIDRGCPFDQATIWARLETDDVLAAGLARLLLWADSRPLPELGDVDGAWDCYARNWRPGRPHPETWPALYAQAMEEVTTNPRTSA